MARDNQRTLRKQIVRVVARLSEEALVTLAVLATFAYAQYTGAENITTFLILFVALGGYLSLRLFKLRSRN